MIAAIPPSRRKNIRVDNDMLDTNFNSGSSRLPPLPSRKDRRDHSYRYRVNTGIESSLSYKSTVNAAGEGNGDTVNCF